MAEVCPAAAPEILIIPGSENRAAALLAGQIDATTAEPADVVQLLAQASDRFHVLVDFASRLPDLVTTGVQVNSAFASAHPQAVRDLVRAVLEIHRRVRADPDLLSRQAVDRLGYDSNEVPAILETHLGMGAWDVDGGLSLEAVEYSLEFYIRTGSLDPGLTEARVADLTILEAVLEEIGRAASSP
jgi:NitT/TauT family transport system substrate-binding protein